MQNETTTKEVRGLSANPSCSDGCGDALHISYSLLSWEINYGIRNKCDFNPAEAYCAYGDRFVIWFAKLKPCLVAMDACGAAHDWARELRALGHDVRLIPPQFVAPYRKGCAHVKNDALDAEAICEAANSPSMRFV